MPSILPKAALASCTCSRIHVTSFPEMTFSWQAPPILFLFPSFQAPAQHYPSPSCTFANFQERLRIPDASSTPHLPYAFPVNLLDASHLIFASKSPYHSAPLLLQFWPAMEKKDQ